MIDEVTKCPYVAGNKITLQLDGRPVQATVVKTFEPWTNSCAMVLSFDSDLSALGIKGNVVLKIYDRRFSTQLRCFSKVTGPWTPEIERDLYQSLCSDEGMEFAIEYERVRIKEIEEGWGFIPTIIEEDTGDEQDEQNTHEQEGTKENDDDKPRGTFFKLSIIATKLFSPLFHAYKMASRGLFCAIRFCRSGATAVLPWGCHKIIDIETQEIDRNDEISGNNSNKNHGTTGEQQTNSLDAGESEDEESEWDHICDEVDLDVSKKFFYQSETEAYEMLKDLQGIHVPRVFAHTKILGPKYTQDQPISRYFEHPGILMEHIEGFPLHEIAENAPKKAWQPVIDKAIEIVNDIMRHGVLNDDVNVRCFIVQPDPSNDAESEYKFELAMIDFSHARFRRQYPPEEDWRACEALKDVEGAIGQVMEMKLKEICEGGYVYKRTPYWQALYDDYRREHC
ncbi:unnamed protein product [Penicillium glandicola]